MTAEQKYGNAIDAKSFELQPVYRFIFKYYKAYKLNKMINKFSITRQLIETICESHSEISKKYFSFLYGVFLSENSVSK